jgi:hypothetical protein
MILRQCRRINGWRWSINALTLIDQTCTTPSVCAGIFSHIISHINLPL